MSTLGVGVARRRWRTVSPLPPAPMRALLLAQPLRATHGRRGAVRFRGWAASGAARAAAAAGGVGAQCGARRPPPSPTTACPHRARHGEMGAVAGASLQLPSPRRAPRPSPPPPQAQAAPPAEKKLWGGRFTGATDPLMEKFNESLPFDKRLWAHDLSGSQAYARALAKAGVLTADEATTIVDGLEAVRGEWAGGAFLVKPGDEDIHTANERRLTELVGAVGGKLHTGRSRNDQVATDARLWLHDHLTTKTRGYLADLIKAAVARAEAEVDVLMPGFTHLQPAQVVRWSHWLLAHAAAWARDDARLADLLPRLATLPLGAGALAGNPFGVDRVALSEDLGFGGRVCPNSMDAVSDRDFVLDTLYFASVTLVHLSRWAEDLIIYSSGAYGYVACSDAYATGSSLMPQKKNPDALELVRGKAGRLQGNLAGMLAVAKVGGGGWGGGGRRRPRGLAPAPPPPNTAPPTPPPTPPRRQGTPTTYNKDFQEAWPLLFDSVDTLDDVLRIATGVLSTLTIKPAAMAAGLSADMLATDLAEYLVRKGVPFRETHHISGAAVKLAEDRGVPLSSLSPSDLRAIHPLFADDVAAVWDFEASAERRDTVGGASRRSVLEQAAKLRAGLAAAGLA